VNVDNLPDNGNRVVSERMDGHFSNSLSKGNIVRGDRQDKLGMRSEDVVRVGKDMGNIGQDSDWDHAGYAQAMSQCNTRITNLNFVYVESEAGTQMERSRKRSRVEASCLFCASMCQKINIALSRSGPRIDF
jgi:hypothetical protein